MGAVSPGALPQSPCFEAGDWVTDMTMTGAFRCPAMASEHCQALPQPYVPRQAGQKQESHTIFLAVTTEYENFQISKNLAANIEITQKTHLLSNRLKKAK